MIWLTPMYMSGRGECWPCGQSCPLHPQALSACSVDDRPLAAARIAAHRRFALPFCTPNKRAEQRGRQPSTCRDLRWQAAQRPRSFFGPAPSHMMQSAGRLGHGPVGLIWHEWVDQLTNDSFRAASSFKAPTIRQSGAGALRPRRNFHGEISTPADPAAHGGPTLASRGRARGARNAVRLPVRSSNWESMTEGSPIRASCCCRHAHYF